MKFEYNMSLEELRMRTSREHYKGITLLTPKSRQVKNLSSKQMQVIKHLCKAASFFDSISLKLDNVHNLEFLEFLNAEADKGDERAVLTRKMFLSQKSMFSPDALGNPTALVKGYKQPKGLGYYPEDLTKKEFVSILKRMLSLDKESEVAKILSQRTIVKRKGDELVAVDFVDAFSTELKQVAEELKTAAKLCEHEGFSDFLNKQAKALLSPDSKLDAEADKAWAKLGIDCLFEFTICRECYGETITHSAKEDKSLCAELKKRNIAVYAKDCLGARVGLVNRRGTKLLIKLKGLMQEAAKYMPFSNEYKLKAKADSNDQLAVDVDLVALTGDEGAYRASIVLAQNLPNDDKFSVQTGCGRRNVYHRQIRKNVNTKLYKALICESDYKYFSAHADHLATICHENTHSLGPVSGSSLGKFSSILEEFKADMGMYAFLPEFKKAGYFDENTCKQIIVTSLACSFAKGKPSLSEAHRTRSVMICNRMLSEGAITLTKQQQLKFNFKKVVLVAKQMMREVIRLQLDGDIVAAENYVKKWFVWSETIDVVAKIIKKYSKKLNGYLVQPLYIELIK